MITITLTIKTFKRNSPLSKAYRVIELGDNTYINKFARVSNDTANLSVSTGPRCLGLAMLEAMYITLYHHTYPNGNSE
jgi:hypothetical protein